ncbi:putative phosphonate metabolism protein [Cribrihabitans marinus]|uniref:Putative phosphonate metabolism protein n=1 Tax=Cribrihabitans marinus TaxID=1227549 RepID=A0A1H7D6C4_9RHOB|nr:DUF1045 domain-containing protein [Cribrihabitans marinus]GGH37848.1 phosphonate metabolism protein [Cribrihabitans marinus]SEJ97358.1 putative phosphonate metabolism protein [Cribrihabitans marinus]
MSYTRFAVYFLPADGPLAAFGARWLGWDAVRGRAVVQPDIEGVAEMTEGPAKYGFHATLKPPFRLTPDQTPEALADAVAGLAARTAPARCNGLHLTRLGRFLALTPVGDATGLARVAAACVRELDAFRAPPEDAELARRRKAHLTDRQEALLRRWGYPYVLDEFRFHTTLTGRLPRRQVDEVADLLHGLLPPLPSPFHLDAVALLGERPDGRFEQISRAALTG